LQSAAFRWDNAAEVCQAPLTNPVSAAYSGTPMGKITAGSTWTIEWPARNHAVANQNPGNVVLYMSPKIANGQAADASAATFKQVKLCEGPFSNCDGGNGDLNPCHLQCTMPKNTADGTYTLWWVWDWTVNDGNIYATCADVQVSGGSSSSSQSSQPIPCTTNSQCKSGACKIDGFCYVAQSSGVDAGGAAAIFFAFLFLAVVIVVVIFAVINRKELKMLKPFNKV